MKTIVINSSNYVANSSNTFVYNLPQSTKFEQGDQVGVASVAVYNSTFNITAARGNNTITVTWVTDTTYTSPVTWTIPDGYYSVSDINYFIQYNCVANGWYLTANNGANNIYFIEAVQNAPRYGVQLNLYAIPTSAQATTLGYTKPSTSTWSFPATATTPQISFNTAFGSLLGFNGATYPASAQSTTYSALSTLTPIISPVNSYIMCCNLVNSRYSIPNNVLFSIPVTTGLGGLISLTPSQIVFNDIASNIYNQITITFFDQLFNKLLMNDTEIVLTLAIKEARESNTAL
jgi:hypothetical protein